MIRWFVFIVIVGTRTSLAEIRGRKVGDKCLVMDGEGECKSILKCQHAMNLVHQEIRPEHCGWVDWDTREELVCCPRGNTDHMFGMFREPFDNKMEISNSKMNCKRHSNWEYILCCPKKLERPPEPDSCPVNPILIGSPILKSHIWRKCRSYQRYLYPCEASKTDPNVYVRSTLRCHQRDRDDRIHSGVAAVKGEFPHMALLGCYSKYKVEWVAGGTLISERFILTAAHALYHNTYNILKYALLGSLVKDTRQGLLYTIVEAIAHELHEKLSNYNDIALVRLDRSVTMSETVIPACLPVPGMEMGDANIVTGWGLTSDGGVSSDVLLQTTINVYNSSVCMEHLDVQHFNKGWFDDLMTCAGDMGPTQNDTCMGDSGGPLQRTLNDRFMCTYMVEGITSWGSVCGTGKPAVYTKVVKYVDWITKIVWPNDV